MEHVCTKNVDLFGLNNVCYGERQIVCQQKNGKLVLTIEQESIEVNYCPICGKRIKDDKKVNTAVQDRKVR
jgi:hypothetical protein